MKRAACEDECDPGRSKSPSKEDPGDVPERTPPGWLPMYPRGNWIGAYRERQANRESPRALYQDHLVAGDGAISSMDGTIQSLSFSMDCTPCVDA